MKTSIAAMLLGIVVFWLPVGAGLADTTALPEMFTAPASQPPDLTSKETAESSRVADAEVRQEADQPTVDQSDQRMIQARPEGRSYRPLCGPAPDAIGDVYCAEGYDSY